MFPLRRLPVLVLTIAAAVPLLAAPVTIRLATQAPAGTIWDTALGDLGSACKRDTEGRVMLRVYAGGTQGDEPATIKKMQTGSLEAGLLTAGGLSKLDQGFNVFTIPFFFETDEEEIAVQKALEPSLEQGLQAKGFHLLAWGTAGWVQIFSKRPLKDLEGVKGAKLYASDDDPDMVQWYTKNGFHPVAMALSDLVTELKLPSGPIDTAPNTPYLAMITGVYQNANYMLNVHIAPLVGATIVKRSVWDQLSQADRDKMTANAKAMETSIRSKAADQDASSIKAMKLKNLQVMTPDKKAMDEFRAAADQMTKSISNVPPDVLKAATDARDAVRRGQAKIPKG